MGNIAAVIKKRSYLRGGIALVVDLTFSGSYATGGDVLPSNAALDLQSSLDCVDAGNTSGGYVCSVDHANRKIKLFRQSAATGALTEVPNATNVSAETCRAVIFGDIGNT